MWTVSGLGVGMNFKPLLSTLICGSVRVLLLRFTIKSGVESYVLFCSAEFCDTFCCVVFEFFVVCSFCLRVCLSMLKFLGLSKWLTGL